MKSALFKLERHYGQTRAYPVSQEAILLVRLTGAKTLLPSAMGTIAGLGYDCIDLATGEPIVPSILC